MSFISRVPIGSRPLVGSSSRISSGSLISAWARPMRRVMPLEYSFSCRLRARSRPTILISSSIRCAEHVVRDVEQPAVEVERLLGVQEPVQIRLFRQVAEPLVLADVGGVFAEHQGLALGGEQQAQQQLDRGRLAGAVGAQQAEDLALLDFQVEGLEGPHLLPAPEVAIDLRQGPRFDDCLTRHALPHSRRRKVGLAPFTRYAATLAPVRARFASRIALAHASSDAKPLTINGLRAGPQVAGRSGVSSR